MNFTRSSSETMTSFQATLVNTGYGQLILRDSLGKVSQKWTLSNPKCVIGSGTNCNVSCQLPGIADHHVLMVIGAKQVFIRALASGLTRNGQNITEHVISGAETDFCFELAGHHFQYSRDGIAVPVAKEFVQESLPPRTLSSPAAPSINTSRGNDAPSLRDTQASAELSPAQPPLQAGAPNLLQPLTADRALTPSRLKFTVVRALEKNRQSMADSPIGIDSGLSTNRPAWVEAIVRDALRPVEERLDDLNSPLQNIERRLRRQRNQMRRASKLRQQKTELAQTQPQIVAVLAPELIQSQAVIEQTVQAQAKHLEKVNQSVQQVLSRMAEVDRQLGTSQFERSQLAQQFQQSNHQIVTMQQELMALVNGLQIQLAQPTVSESSAEVRMWQTNVEAQLAELQATLLTLDDIKLTLQAAVEQNRGLKSELEAQPQRLLKQISETVQKVLLDTSLSTNIDASALSQIISDRVGDSLRELLGTRFINDVAQQLSDSLNNEFAAPLASQLSTQLSGELNQQLNHTLQNIRPIEPAPVGMQAEEMAAVVRSTVAEMLAPLQGSLQESLQGSLHGSLHDSLNASLQQSIQQAVDAAVHQTVQQTLAPIVEAASQAQLQAAAAPLQFQLPNVQGPVASPYDARALHPLTESQALAEPTYPPQIAEAPSHDSAGNHPQAYDSAADKSQGQAYAEQPYADPYGSQGFDSQPYVSPAYESSPYESPAYNPAAYAPTDYEPTTAESSGNDARVSDSQAYDMPQFAAEQDGQAIPSRHSEQEQSVESHARELPSWWSDEPAQRRSARDLGAAEPISADNDSASYDPHGVSAYATPDQYPAQYPSLLDSGYELVEGQAVEPTDGYAQSAFSAEQLELNNEHNNELDNESDAEHDSVPYSELVNRKPVIHPDEREDAYGRSANYDSDYSPEDYSPEDYSPREDRPSQSIMAPVGADYDATDYDATGYGSANYDPNGYDPNGYDPNDCDPNDCDPNDCEPGAQERDEDQYSGAHAERDSAEQYDAEQYDAEQYDAEALARIAQPEHLTQSVPARDNPTVPASQAQAGEDGDESVEDYMRRLLARMRGVSETEVTVPGGEPTKPVAAAPAKDPSVAQPAGPVVTGEAPVSEAWTEPFDPDKYVPRGTAPEKNRDLNALRELANTSARSAIQVSARRRHGSAILLKSAIALVGLIAGIALVSINGARINIAFIATIASFMVALIWGYDALSSIRPLLQSRHHAKPKPQADTAETPNQE